MISLNSGLVTSMYRRSSEKNLIGLSRTSPLNVGGLNFNRVCDVRDVLRSPGVVYLILEALSTSLFVFSNFPSIVFILWVHISTAGFISVAICRCNVSNPTLSWLRSSSMNFILFSMFVKRSELSVQLLIVNVAIWFFRSAISSFYLLGIIITRHLSNLVAL